MSLNLEYAFMILGCVVARAINERELDLVAGRRDLAEVLRDIAHQRREAEVKRHPALSALGILIQARRG